MQASNFDSDFRPQHGTGLPSWLGSLVVHLALLLALALLFQGRISPPPPEPARVAEIVLKRSTDVDPTTRDSVTDALISAEHGRRIAHKVALDDPSHPSKHAPTNVDSSDTDLLSTDASGLPAGD